MKAVRFHAHGAPEVLTLEDAPDPIVPPDGVLVEVRAASVNHLDIWLRKGMPGIKVPFPKIVGADAAGVVRLVGPLVKRVQPGQRVTLNPGIQCCTCEFCTSGRGSMCLTYTLIGENSDGAYAGLIAVPERNVHAIPDAMSFEEAAAYPLVYLTAWSMLVTKAQVRPGEDVLILSAGAGVGTACIQIAKMCGARVFATASTDEKVEKCKAIGADVGINYAAKPFDTEIRRITEKRGVDVVVDYIGKDTWQQSLRSLRRGGRLVTCGATTGYDPVEDLRHIFFRQVEILGSTMGSMAEFDEVTRCVFRGQLKPIIDRVMPLADAAEAHRLIEARKTFGKIVLTP